jgi:hypothetical protein
MSFEDANAIGQPAPTATHDRSRVGDRRRAGRRRDERPRTEIDAMHRAFYIIVGHVAGPAKVDAIRHQQL